MVNYLENGSINSDKEVKISPIDSNLIELSSDYNEIQKKQIIQKNVKNKDWKINSFYDNELNLKPHMFYDNNSLVIDGNNNFTQTAMLNSWPGNGTELDPYILKNLNVSTLNISNVDLFFEIDNITTTPIDSNLTISLVFIKNGKIKNSVLCDVFVQNSSNIEFNNNVGFLGLTAFPRENFWFGYIVSNKIFGSDVNNSKFYSNMNFSISIDYSNENIATVNKNVSISFSGSNNLVKTNFMWGIGLNGEKNKLIGNYIFNYLPHETWQFGGFSGTNGIMQNNTFIVNKEYTAIHISGSNHYVTNNSFVNGGDYTIEINGNNHILNGNRFDNGYSQIFFNINISIINNVFNNSAIETINLVSSVISNNTMTFGDFVVGGASHSIISYNNITSNGVFVPSQNPEVGMTINGLNNSIFNNIIEDCRSGINIGGKNNKVTNNLIIQNNVTEKENDKFRFSSGFGVTLFEDSQFNVILNNTLIENRLDIYPDRSQIVDNGTGNVIEFNYYDEWTSPDDDDDGIVDEPYPIFGTSNNFDYHPVKFPFSSLNIQNLPHLLVGLRILYPNGNENLKGIVTISWTPVIDIHGHKITYSVYVSNNGGSWTLLESDLTSNTYDWDTSSLPFGFDYLIKVVAECEEGLQISDVSDNTFKILNPEQNDSTTSGPPVTSSLNLIPLIQIFIIMTLTRLYKDKHFKN